MSTRLPQAAAAVASGLNWLLFPTYCAGCGEGPRNSPICPACRDSIVASGRPACQRCGVRLGPHASVGPKGCAECRGVRLGFAEVVTLGAYEEPLRSMCVGLKRETGAWMADWLADLLVEVEGSRLTGLGASGVTAVPLHWRRRVKRRYNQSSLLASRLARRLGLPVGSWLRRREGGGVLAGSTRTERLDRMKRAFAPPLWWKPHLDGQTILLVDDVLTTGATCGAAARVLRSLGASRVIAVAIARAEGV